MEYIVPIINFLGSVCSILAYFKLPAAENIGPKMMRSIRIILITNFVLLLLVSILGLFYFNTVSARIRAQVFYERYKNTTFANDFSGVKLRAVVADGMVIMDDLGFKEKHPTLYANISEKYKKVNAVSFDKEAYIDIATEMFGALGSISGNLYKNSKKQQER